MNNNIEDALLNLEKGEGYGEYHLHEFREIYRKIINHNLLTDHTAFVSFLEDRVFIIFSDKPNVRFVIRKEKDFFNKNDFNFLSNAEYFGTYNGKYRFYDFIKEEKHINGTKLLMILLIFFMISFLIYSNEMIRTINEMILTSITIFISIFLLFVISQNDKRRDKNLMKDGTIYRFFQIDKYISYIAVFVVFLSIINVALSYVNYEQINTFSTSLILPPSISI